MSDPWESLVPWAVIDVWQDANTGVWCAIRVAGTRTLNGYVRLPLSHPWHGLGHPEIEALTDLHVHGGLTFSGWGMFDEGYWIGFDCAHYMDHVPGIMPEDEGIWRDVEYVRAECSTLAAQVRGAL